MRLNFESEINSSKISRAKVNIDVGIDSFFQRAGVIYYNIHVKSKLFTLEFSKRYSDFVTLETKLKLAYPEIVWPPLPEKIYFGNTDRSKIEARRDKLEKYMVGLIAIYSESFQYEEITTFIGLASEETQKLNDLADSNIQVGDKVTLLYLQLIYNKRRLSENSEVFLHAATRYVISKQAASLILFGEGNILSIFQVAFDPPTSPSRPCNNLPSRDSSRIEASPRVSQLHLRPIDSKQVENHYKCSQFSRVILRLFSLTNNINGETFRNMILNKKIDLWRSAFSTHLCSKLSTECKFNCYQLLQVLIEFGNLKSYEMLFSSAEEAQTFSAWYKTRKINLQNEPRASVYEESFPKIHQILFNSEISSDFLRKTLDRFTDKRTIDTFIVDSSASIYKLFFLIRPYHRRSLLESIADFSWSANALLVENRTPTQPNVAQKKVIINSFEGDSSLFYISFFNVHQVKCGQRIVMFFSDDDVSDWEKEKYQEALRAKLNLSEKPSLQVFNHQLGFFVDIVPSPTNKGFDHVSIVLTSDFLAQRTDKRYDVIKATFTQLGQNIKRIKKYYDETLKNMPDLSFERQNSSSSFIAE